MRKAIALFGLAVSLSCAGSDAVSGRVVDMSGQPIAGARVRVGSAAAVSTDAQGRFQVDAVSPRYDAAVVVDAANFAIVYSGLTRRDPTLYSTIPMPYGPQSPTQRATLLQSIRGTAFDVLDTQGVHTPGVPTSPPSVFFWYGPVPSKVRIAAVDLGVQFSGHADVQVTEDQPLDVSIPATPTKPMLLSASVNPPQWCPRAFVSRNVVLPGTWRSPAVSSTVTATGTSDVRIGWTDEVPLSFRATANCIGPMIPDDSITVARRITASMTTLQVDFPPPPVLVDPANGTSIPLYAAFTWTPPPGSVSVLRFFDANNASGLLPPPRLDVVTSAATATFPDLSSLGARVGLNENYAWSVESWDGIASADAAADPTGLGAKLSGLGDFAHGISSTYGVWVVTFAQ
jgi:Carboxypeptidase regulatory-like domain